MSEIEKLRSQLRFWQIVACFFYELAEFEDRELRELWLEDGKPDLLSHRPRVETIVALLTPEGERVEVELRQPGGEHFGRDH